MLAGIAFILEGVDVHLGPRPGMAGDRVQVSVHVKSAQRRLGSTPNGKQ